MTDVMNAGIYPHDPLLGPRHSATWKRLPMPSMPNTSFVWNDTPRPMLPNVPFVWNDASPILERPMYFPGANWAHSVTYG